MRKKPAMLEPYIGPYTKHEWWVMGILLVSYLGVFEANAYFLPPSLGLHFATPIALVALFFGGLRLWPVVYLTALAAVALSPAGVSSLLFIPVAVTLQAVAGSFFLRRANVDPLFRRARDSFGLMTTVLGISVLAPTALALASALRRMPYSVLDWAHGYAAAIFCFIIITPFLLRWVGKPRFRRTWGEIGEIAVAFVALVALAYVITIGRVGLVFGISLVYLLLIPLFYIALRLRPRFETLALVIVSAFGIASVLRYGTDLGTQMFSMEVFLTVLSSIFIVITSIEEDRRANFNLAKSQLATLENAVARISSESSAKNDFIAILAHELRNPLAPVVSGIEMLRLKGSSDPEKMELFAMMADRMDTVRRLLDDLLDISRIAEGKVAIATEPVDLRAVLSRSIVSTEHLRSERHQSLSYREPSEPLSLTGDAVRLEQIFSNLLSNASKYSKSGDTVRLRARRLGAHIEVDVSDEGVGLAPGASETIFLPFQQAEPGRRSQKGLGIGLALVKSFVEIHGGTVSVESEGPGRGTRFSVRLPYVSAVPKAKENPPGEENPMPAKNGGPTMLVVDDNDAAALGIGRLLEFSGCHVSYAYAGAQALEEASRLSPDVVILDVGLPDMDGYAVARELRARGFGGKLVALSGYSTEEARSRSRDAGFDTYLIKPASLADLQEAIRLGI